jgi:hypothetical protein
LSGARRLWWLVGAVALSLCVPTWAWAQDGAGKPAKTRAKKKRAAEKRKPKGQRGLTLAEAAKRAAKGKAKPPPVAEPAEKKAPPEDAAADAEQPAGPPGQSQPSATQPAEEAEEPKFQRSYAIPGGLLSHFHAVLSEYGAWTTDAKLGLIWVPDVEEVGTRFAPYVSEGHWEVTKKGSWAWASDYDWGHIPFHYGRWEWDEEHGWAWVPGTRWAPAWVIWRLTPSGYDYSAWAPIPASHAYRYDPTTTSKARDAAFTLRRRPGKRPLRFMFVFNQYLFDDNVGERVIWDPDVAAWLGARSKTFRRHGKSMRPASPTFAQAAVPNYWTPLHRIEITDDRVRPFVLTRR